ncbi:MAG: polynucleotide kinase-phosphatase [Phycisphaerae bacterium]
MRKWARRRRWGCLRVASPSSLLTIPELSLVVLIGPSGSGKSTFASKHFLSTEVLRSDYCRGLVADDENDQSVTPEAFELLHFIAAKRLAKGKLTVVDATNVRPEDRKPLVALARQYHCLPVAIVFNLPEKICQERNRGRTDRDFGPHVIRGQRSQMRRSLRGLKRSGFRHIFTFETPEDVDAATIERVPLWNNRKTEHGPFDIIGDLHGCCDELEQLLRLLGYEPKGAADDDGIWTGPIWSHAEGRKAIFLGDLVDRGPRILDCVRLVRNMVQAEKALAVPGNHDLKLVRKLRGKDVRITHGLAGSLAEIERLPSDMRDGAMKGIADFLYSLVSHFVLDDGKLVVAHAGMKAEMQGRGSGKVREFAMYGETTGETDEFGLPVRHDWAAEYRGSAMVIYGHTPIPEVEWLNRTINIDTGCVFGGKLTALRYPEKELVSVPAARIYCEPAKPFLAVEDKAPVLSAQQDHDDLLDIQDVIGKRIVTTRLRSCITIREENTTAALEVMSRFAANPKWLIYLPPTMSPCETSKLPDYLEYPSEAFAYYRSQGIGKSVCEEKHMGSRAVVIVCKDAEAARKRFGIVNGEAGIVYTRTGRRFFDDMSVESELLELIRAALSSSNFWEEFSTNWVCLDCELMPWSAKAQELLKQQYAAVGAASQAALCDAVPAMEMALDRGVDVREILDRYQTKTQQSSAFIGAYRHYCWPVESVTDLKLAPFHVLATEGKVHIDRDHTWHMEALGKVCDAADAVLLKTSFNVINLSDPQSEQVGVDWWLRLTEHGGEGMVVKPLEFVVRGTRGLIQPAIKCRGREYLRIIYGSEYTSAEHLDRLRSRGLATKRSLAIREFALGIEALERFVRGEPLRRVHECVFAVLAFESEPVDPRL